GSRRTDARGITSWFASGEFFARRRQQRYLGAARRRSSGIGGGRMRPPRNFYVKTYRREAGMLSRVADNLYWMSRYLERAEHTARLLDVNLHGMLDQTAESADHRWDRVLTALST